MEESAIPHGRFAIRRAILGAVRDSPGIARIQIARQLGVTPSAVSLAVKPLQAAGLIVPSGTTHVSGGRPTEGLVLNASGPLMVGVDLGETSVRVGVANLRGQLIAETSSALSMRDGSVVLDAMLRPVQELLARYPDVLGVGVAVPGILNKEKSRVRYAANLGWREMPLLDQCLSALGISVFLERNTSAALLAERWWGARSVADPIVFVTVGSGFGAATMAGGVLLDGASGAAGEIGHLQLYPDGTLCRCGRRGCLETRATATALIAKAGTSIATVDAVRTAVSRGNGRAIEAMTAVGVAIGDGLAVLVGLVNPELVLLGGEAMEASDVLLPIIRERVAAGSLREASVSVRIEASALGQNAPLIGAATLGFSRLFDGRLDDIHARVA